MSLRSTFILMVLFLVLGSFAVFDPFSLKAKQEEKREKSEMMFWLKGKKIETLDVKNGPLVLRISCEISDGCPIEGNGKWSLLSPLLDKADDETVNATITSLQNISPNEKIDLETEPDQKEFGFADSGLEFSFRVKGEKDPYLVKFGSRTPVGPNTYAESSHEPKRVFIVANYFAEQFRKDLFHWRNKRLFPQTQAAKIEKISWQGKKNKLSAQKRDGYWFLISPIEARASFTMLEGIANTIEFLEARTIFSEKSDDTEAKKILSGRPELVLQFDWLGKQEKVSFYAHPKKDTGLLVAKVEGRDPLYNLNAQQFDRFEKELAEYRNRRLAPYEAANKADELHLEFPRDNKKITLKKNGNVWIYASGDNPAETLSQKRIDGFVSELANAEVISFVKSKEKVSLFARLVDVKVILQGDGRELANLRFVLDSKNTAITAGDFPDEVRVLGGDFLRVLPIRLENLYESANKQVVTEPVPPATTEEGDHHGHTH